MTTGIEWTDETWNPVTGCDRISPGCDNCYALDLAARWKRAGQPKYQNDGNPRTSGPGFGVTVHLDELKRPTRWRRKPRLVFVNSMSDLFHQEVSDEFIENVFVTMEYSTIHTFQILTKRPPRMKAFMRARYADDNPPPNVWLGTSVETDRYRFRVDHLRQTPAAVRFLSLEPLLGPLPNLDLAGVDWVILGGESGPKSKARPIDPAWVRDIRDQCLETRTPFFFKQWGTADKSKPALLDGEAWQQFPGTPLNTTETMT